MLDNIADISIVVQLLSLVILVTTTLTLVIAAFSYAGYKMRKRAPSSTEDEKPVFFEHYVPALALHNNAAGVARSSGLRMSGNRPQPD